MSYRTYWVNPELLDSYWYNDSVQSCLQRTYKTYPKSRALSSFYEMCKNYHALLFIQELNGEVIFAGIAEYYKEKSFITKMSGKRKRRKNTILNVSHGAGLDFTVNFDQLDTVAHQMANLLGARIIQVQGRLGWKKHSLPRGYKVHSKLASSCGKTIYLFRKEVRDNGRR